MLHCPWRPWAIIFCLDILWSVLWWFWKISWYLQNRFWVVKMTYIGSGVTPSWITRFLWFQIAQRVMNISCKFFMPLSSKLLCLIMELMIHCWTAIGPREEVCRARADPYQQALAKWQWRKRWLADSSSQSQKRQRAAIGIPLLFKAWKVFLIHSFNNYLFIVISHVNCWVHLEDAEDYTIISSMNNRFYQLICII